MIRPAIVIVDMLNDFVTGKLKIKRAEHIIPELQRLIVEARKNDVPVILSNDAHNPEDIEVTRRWGEHAIKGSPGAQVIPELAPDPSKDYIIEKTTYSSFYETNLEELLRGLYKGEGAQTLILGGLHTHICIRHLAADAFFRGYHIVVAGDGVEAFTGKDHRQGLKYLENVYGAKIMTVNEIIEDFTKSTTS